MKFETLKSAVPSLELIAGTASNISPESISRADDPQPNTFVFVKNQRFLNKLLEKDFPDNLGVIIPYGMKESMADGASSSIKEAAAWIASVENVDSAMCSLSKLYYERKFSELNNHVDGRQMGTAQVDPDSEIAQNVFIGEGVVISKGVVIMPGCVIMANCHIGEGTVLYPSVTLYPFSYIGKNCRIHSQTVIGADGFGYNFVGGEHRKIWHFGGVEIHDDVEIGSNSCVDAGAFAPTSIGAGSKLDNFVQVAHNCRIGKHCVLCGQAGIAGSVVLEDYVVIGAGGGCAPGALLKQGSQLGARSVVSENAVWGPKETLAGHPARPLKEWLRTQAKINIMTKSSSKK